MRIIALIAIVALLGCQEEPPVTELEGTWEVVSFVAFGEPDDLDGQNMRVEGNRMRRRKRDTAKWQSDEKFSLNPSVAGIEPACHQNIAKSIPAVLWWVYRGNGGGWKTRARE